MELNLSRRRFLVGCSAAASPLLSRMTFAAAPGENRLVVVILRGAMDGLDAVRPYGDPGYAALRPTLGAGERALSPALDGPFHLHPALAPLLPLWATGELAVAQAVSTPYRDRRSHFHGQDVLENGGPSEDGALTAPRDGWLSRALGGIAGAQSRFAISVGYEPMLILEGAAPSTHWLPSSAISLSPQALLLLEHIYQDDSLFAAAYATAAELLAESPDADRVRGDAGLGAFVAEKLRAEARIAAFSMSGWDTHRSQAATLPRSLGRYVEMLMALRTGLGPVWSTTLVLTLTEFGRTARENGSGGTDHGTGGAAFLAGGALKGKRVLGNWPGLADLYAGRDLMPTTDVRGIAAAALREMFGLDLGFIGGTVFPGLDTDGLPSLAL